LIAALSGSNNKKIKFVFMQFFENEFYENEINSPLGDGGLPHIAALNLSNVKKRIKLVKVICFGEGRIFLFIENQ